MQLEFCSFNCLLLGATLISCNFLLDGDGHLTQEELKELLSSFSFDIRWQFIKDEADEVTALILNSLSKTANNVIQQKGSSSIILFLLRILLLTLNFFGMSKDFVEFLNEDMILSEDAKAAQKLVLDKLHPYFAGRYRKHYLIYFMTMNLS